jgi:hypothetical protein
MKQQEQRDATIIASRLERANSYELHAFWRQLYLSQVKQSVVHDKSYSKIFSKSHDHIMPSTSSCTSYPQSAQRKYIQVNGRTIRAWLR